MHVIYMSVDTATQRSTAIQGDTWRDKKETARIAENSQLAGRFRRWWQVLGSNQGRRSRRFYRPLLHVPLYCDLPVRTPSDRPCRGDAVRHMYVAAGCRPAHRTDSRVRASKGRHADHTAPQAAAPADPDPPVGYSHGTVAPASPEYGMQSPYRAGNRPGDRHTPAVYFWCTCHPSPVDRVAACIWPGSALRGLTPGWQWSVDRRRRFPSQKLVGATALVSRVTANRALSGSLPDFSAQKRTHSTWLEVSGVAFDATFGRLTERALPGPQRRACSARTACCDLDTRVTCWCAA